MTPPVSQDLREAVARLINPVAFSCTPEMYGVENEDDPRWRQTFTYGARIVARQRADAILAGPIASELARLAGERDAAREAVALCNNSFGSYSYHLNPHPAEMIEKVKRQATSEWQRARAAEARLASAAEEIARLRRALQDCRDTIANPNPGICCTIWFDNLTTLQDHIDLALNVGRTPYPEAPLFAAITPKETGHE